MSLDSKTDNHPYASTSLDEDNFDNHSKANMHYPKANLSSQKDDSKAHHYRSKSSLSPSLDAQNCHRPSKVPNKAEANLCTEC